ncbi:hypothetical protein [Flavobacterium lindanitolerans]|jgi:hypothetical protein|uniref:hypothetical protein n=1 Tax=Flavobacterium lindanitolerans TaxID=428988 RepID=UPI0023F460AD|nr:hypothetical protein [Flavobacterium lindanitolerans]
MKRKSILIILCISFLLSCKTSSKFNRNDIPRDKEKKEWIFAFKAQVFYECLKNNNVMIEEDASPSLNFQVLGDFNVLSKTNAIGKNYSKIINDRATWLKGGDLEGYKAITNGCLFFFESKELDSIANSEYRNMKSNSKKN